VAYTGEGANVMLDGLRAVSTHIGLFNAPTASAFTVAASTNLVTLTAHGYSNGDLVVMATLTGGTGLFQLRPYRVVSATTNTFSVAETISGSAIDVTTDGSGTIHKLTELTGGSPAYARKAITYAAAAARVVDDSTNGVTFDIPAGSGVMYIGRFSASTAGTCHSADVANPQEPTYAGQGTYTVSDSKFHLNSAA
jgi:hypothetical protein